MVRTKEQVKYREKSWIDKSNLEVSTRLLVDPNILQNSCNQVTNSYIIK